MEYDISSLIERFIAAGRRLGTEYVADHRVPAPLPGYDPNTGRKTWDPATVCTWHTQRPGQGTRTDLTYLPSPDGYPVFINPTTITTATPAARPRQCCRRHHP